MHAAKLSASPRLKRLGRALWAQKWTSTMELCRKARVVAVSAAVSELRDQGWRIECRQRQGRYGRVFEYSVHSMPKAHEAVLD